MRRFTASAALPATVSFIALATAFATPAYAQTGTTQPAPAPAPEACANIKDEAQKQACSSASEQVDPLANQGELETSPTQGGVANAETTPGERGAIVVTGSRLRRDERTSADPVAVIDPTVQAREGRLDTAEVLLTNPLAAGSFQITSTISTNFVINGGEGVQTVSLRGLGANRTLVLLNGRRAGPAGVRGGVSSFDLNVIPLDAVQSIEILKTGASSVYGSDAIAGVVNIITKKDLRGLQFSASTSYPLHNGGEQYRVSAIYGLGIGDRGHAMVGVDYNRQNDLAQGDRDFLGCAEENVRNQAGARVDPIDPRTGQPSCGSFANNQIFLARIGFGMLGNNLQGPCVLALPGVTGSTCPAGSNTIRRAIGSIQFNGPGMRLDEFLSGTNAGLFFNPTNPSQFDAPAGFFPVGSFSATGLALAQNWNPALDRDSIIPKTDRFTIFGEAGYDLTDDVNLYFEGLYNRRKTKTIGHAQLFFYQFPGNATTRFPGYNLPYFFCDGTTCDPNAPGDPLNTGFSGSVLLNPVIIRPVDSGTDVKYYRGVAGAHANLDKILPHGFGDIYFQHSRSDGDFTRTHTFRDAIEFGVAELRTDLCAGTLTAIRGVPCIDINYTDPRVLRGEFTPEERAFLFGQETGNTLYKQSTLEASFGGDVFTLPGGPMKFALGGQWRRDSINDVPGEITLSDNVWGSTTSGITAGTQRTLEAFGEVEFPLLRDLPAVHELTVNAAARVTSTKAKRASDGASDADKGNWTYKLAASYMPQSWVKFRATYGTSFRSPALFEQFLADESGFLGQNLDPCRQLDVREVTERIRQNCLSQGIPLDHIGGSSFETFSGGGIGQLDPETSRALTLSAIFTPDGWLWGGGQASLAIDYVDIKVKNQVTQLGAANILLGCYDSENFPDDPLCSLFTRDTGGPNPTFDILEVQDPFLNIDQQHNRSVDVTARFRQDLGNMGTLSLLGQMTYTMKDQFTLFRGFEADDNGESGDPKWVGNLTLTWAKNPFTVTYGLRMISATSDAEDFQNSNPGLATTDECFRSAAGFALRGGIYCPVVRVPRVAYHSLSAEVQATKDLNFTVGVANMFDKKPPLISTVASPISSLGQVPLLGTYYDYFGRRIFVTARAKLGAIGDLFR